MGVLFRKSNAGMTLMDALLTAFIVGILTAGIAKMTALGMKSQKSGELRSELQSIKQNLDMKLDCTKTLTPYGAKAASCTNGTKVAVLDSNGATVIPSAGTKMGSWTVAARCETLTVDGAAKMGLSIYATRPDGKGGFLGDPLRDSSTSRVSFDETHPVSKIYNANVRPCSCLFDGSSCSSSSMPTSTVTPTPCAYGLKYFDQRTSSNVCLALTEFCSLVSMVEDSTKTKCVASATAKPPTPSPTPTATSSTTPTATSTTTTTTTGTKWKVDRACSTGETKCQTESAGVNCSMASPYVGVACASNLKGTVCYRSSNNTLYKCSDD